MYEMVDNRTGMAWLRPKKKNEVDGERITQIGLWTDQRSKYSC